MAKEEEREASDRVKVPVKVPVRDLHQMVTHRRKSDHLHPSGREVRTRISAEQILAKEEILTRLTIYPCIPLVVLAD